MCEKEDREKSEATGSCGTGRGGKEGEKSPLPGPRTLAWGPPCPPPKCSGPPHFIHPPQGHRSPIFEVLYTKVSVFLI